MGEWSSNIRQEFRGSKVPKKEVVLGSTYVRRLCPVSFEEVVSCDEINVFSE